MKMNLISPRLISIMIWNMIWKLFFFMCVDKYCNAMKSLIYLSVCHFLCVFICKLFLPPVCSKHMCFILCQFINHSGKKCLPKENFMSSPEHWPWRKILTRQIEIGNIQKKIPQLNALGARPLEQALEGPTRCRVSPEDKDDDANMEYMPSRSEAELSSSGEDHLKDEVIVVWVW